jgi:hypothetical protein
MKVDWDRIEREGREIEQGRRVPYLLLTSLLRYQHPGLDDAEIRRRALAVHTAASESVA